MILVPEWFPEQKPGALSKFMPKITRQKLTPDIIKGLACPPGAKEAFFWDAEVRGLGLRIYANGRRSWVYAYRNGDGRRLRVTLKAMDLRTARLEAGQHSRNVAGGGDPQVEAKDRRKAATVLEIVELYLVARKSLRTIAKVKRALMVLAKPLHHLKAERVTRREVVGVLDAVKLASGGVAANRLRSYLSAMWAWALRSGQVEGSNPVANTPRPVDEKSRDRVLTDDELALIWRCTAGGGDYHRIVRLLILTVVRVTEAGGMLVSELEGAVGAKPIWLLPGERTKNGLPHEVPMPSLALEQVPSWRLPSARPNEAAVFGLYGTGFSGWSKSKERLDAHMLATMVKDFEEAHGRAPEADEVVLTPWRHHDLRRTFSTWANENGVEPHVVEAVLNHASGPARRGVAGVYNKAQYRTQKRAALAAWERHIRAVCGVPSLGGNVTELRAVA